MFYSLLLKVRKGKMMKFLVGLIFHKKSVTKLIWSMKSLYLKMGKKITKLKL